MYSRPASSLRTTRREKETNDLRQVLQERERQLRDAADELSQMGKTHQVRLEALAAEKASLDEELEVCALGVP